MDFVQAYVVESLSKPVVDLFRGESLCDGWDPHHLGNEGVGRPPGGSGFEPEGFKTGYALPLSAKTFRHCAYSLEHMAMELFPLVLDHRHDPIDLDIDNPGQGKRDQNKDNRENFFQTHIFNFGIGQRPVLVQLQIYRKDKGLPFYTPSREGI